MVVGRPKPAPHRFKSAATALRRALTTAVLGLTLLVAPAGAVAHPGISVSLKIAINDQAIEYTALLSADLVHQIEWDSGQKIPRPRIEAGRTSYERDEQAETARTMLVALLPETIVTIDGVAVRPIIEEAAFIPAMSAPVGGEPVDFWPPDARFVLRYPTTGRPRQVALVWHLFPLDPMRTTFGMPPEIEIVAELDAYDENRLIIFSKDEPEVIWHAPTAPPQQRVWPVLTDAPPRATVTLPLATVGLGLIAAAAGSFAALRWRRPRVARPALVAGVGAAVLAAVAWPAARSPFELPWPGELRAPSDAEVRDIFERLQKNVYRAFEYKKESDIYDVLAQSVDGPLLDSVYNEVYQSLVLRDQGGAVARVKDVKIVSTDILSTGREADRGAVAVQLASTWQVDGSVFHWGHTHNRTNQYSALYTLAQRGDRWKITGVEVLSHERIIKEGDDPLPLLSVPPGSS